MADPVAASVSLAKRIAIDCLQPQIKYPIKCGIFACQCYLMLTASPVLTTSVTASANQIAEAILEDL